MNSLAVKKLNYYYDFCSVGEVYAIKDASLHIGAGELVAITGPSGSGKTTLLKLLGGLLTPTDGTVLLDENPLTPKRGLAGRTSRAVEKAYEHLRNKVVGYVQQDYGLVEEDTVLNNVMLPLIVAGQSRKKAAPLALKALNSVAIPDLQRRRVSKLSGGQKQRVAIARAIVNDPDIILADEPTGNLDSRTSAEVMETLARLNKDGKTVIVVTHNTGLLSCFKRVIGLEDGRIVSDSTGGAEADENGKISAAELEGLRVQWRKERRRAALKRVILTFSTLLLLIASFLLYKYYDRNRVELYAGINIAGVEVSMVDVSEFSSRLLDGKEKEQARKLSVSLGGYGQGIFFNYADRSGSLNEEPKGGIRFTADGGVWVWQDTKKTYVQTDGQIFLGLTNPTLYPQKSRYMILIDGIPQPFTIDQSKTEVFYTDLLAPANSELYVPVTVKLKQAEDREFHTIECISMKDPGINEASFMQVNAFGRYPLDLEQGTAEFFVANTDIPISFSEKPQDNAIWFYMNAGLEKKISQDKSNFSDIAVNGQVTLYLVMETDATTSDLMTYVFVDDEILTLSNGRAYYNWSSAEMKSVVFPVTIPLDDLEPGKHSLYATTLLNNPTIMPGDEGYFTPVDMCTQKHIFTVTE